MVTSNKLPDKKVFKMSDDSSTAVVPQRTLLGEVNAHLTCYLCRGYYIDATTIVECLHSFCRSCIIKHLQVKTYCPVCEMMINAAKPNIKPDKALQDIVYKLVPGLFQKEMERRRSFYASRPGPAATATPEQRGEDTERIIFSPEDVISFSLEYADATDSDSISSKSSDSNEQPPAAVTRRFLQCPAVVNISHLKKFLSMKFDIDNSQYSIDILYKRVPLPDYYTLMDIAYIYNWKRNKPMRFFYQIKDYIAIRNRYGLFDINRKGSHFHEKKPQSLHADDTSVDSPAPLGSEASSGADSPMPEESYLKRCDTRHDQINKEQTSNGSNNINKDAGKSNDEDVQKSQFLNSFELTAKNNVSPDKSPTKSRNIPDSDVAKRDQINKERINNSPSKSYPNLTAKLDENVAKRKQSTPPTSPEVKKYKVSAEKPNISSKPSGESNKVIETAIKSKESATSSKMTSSQNTGISKTDNLSKEDNKSSTLIKQQVTEHNSAAKRPIPVTQSLSPPKRKAQDSITTSPAKTTEQKFVSPLKIQLPKPDSPHSTPIIAKPTELPKPVTKKMPDLKLSVPSTSLNQNKSQVPKLRMDLLANNCDPTMDRSKILPHVKTTMPPQTGQASGDPLKSLFDSCKINIPSSLSITLTDQKQEPSKTSETITPEFKKPLSKPMITANMMFKPLPPVHNYIEIVKMPDGDQTVSPSKPEVNQQPKPILPNKKPETINPPKSIAPNKPTDAPPSAKGPIPSLKPIGEAKLGKPNFLPATSPFQQKYIQSLEEKAKLPKNKMQVPKLMPATPKILNAALNKEPQNKILPTSSVGKDLKPRTDVLDLSTSHNLQSQLGPQQTKKLETMQTIANLARKQTLTNKGIPINMQNNQFAGIQNRSLAPDVPQMRMINATQMRSDKIMSQNLIGITPRLEGPKQNTIRQICMTSSSPSPIYQMTQTQSPMNAQASPRQTRSPSSSPKLVIAEDKQTPVEANVNHSNQMLNAQIISNVPKMDHLKMQLPGPSKIAIKPMKPLTSGIRQPITPTIRPGQMLSTDIVLQPQMFPQELIRHHMEWIKTQQARQQYELLKSYTNAQQNQKDFNKDNENKQ